MQHLFYKVLSALALLFSLKHNLLRTHLCPHRPLHLRHLFYSPVIVLGTRVFTLEDSGSGQLT